MKVNNWKGFKVADLFEINKGKVPTGANVPVQDLVDGTLPRITVTNINNGISGYFNYIGKNPQNYRIPTNSIIIR